MTELAAVEGQDCAQRVTEVAVRGEDSLLLAGGPGHGKILLAMRVVSALHQPAHS